MSSIKKDFTIIRSKKKETFYPRVDEFNVFVSAGPFGYCVVGVTRAAISVTVGRL